METITTAAIIIDYANARHLVTLPRPARHSDLIDFAHEHVNSFRIYYEGFMTSENRFVLRNEAAQIAAAANQIISDDFNPSTLYTEDLW